MVLRGATANATVGVARTRQKGRLPAPDLVKVTWSTSHVASGDQGPPGKHCNRHNTQHAQAHVVSTAAPQGDSALVGFDASQMSFRQSCAIGGIICGHMVLMSHEEAFQGKGWSLQSSQSCSMESSGEPCPTGPGAATTAIHAISRTTMAINVRVTPPMTPSLAGFGLAASPSQ